MVMVAVVVTVVLVVVTGRGRGGGDTKWTSITEYLPAAEYSKLTKEKCSGKHQLPCLTLF